MDRHGDHGETNAAKKLVVGVEKLYTSHPHISPQLSEITCPPVILMPS